MKKVFVNGYGSIGSRITSFLKDDPEITVIGIAKRLEEIYFPDDSVPLYINKNSETLKIIQQLRDEAHRFGIEFHRRKRTKSLITSELDSIKGIGEKSVQKLLMDFKSVKNVKSQSYDSLTNSIGKSKATLVYKSFQS